MNFSIEIARELINSGDRFPVNFNELWQWCGYKRKDYAKQTLIKNFERGLDFSAENRKTSNTGRPSESIELTIDAAKQFAMLAQTDRGKMVRKYFLEVERQYDRLNQPYYQLPRTYLEALKELVIKEEENQKLKLQAAEDKPKIEFADAIAASNGSLDWQEFAKSISTSDWKIGRNKLLRLLREMKIIMKNSTLPYQKFCDAGFFEVSQELTLSGRTVPFSLVTPKGQLWLHGKIKKHLAYQIQAVNAISSGVLFDILS